MSLAVKRQLMVAPASFRSDTRALMAFFRLSASAVNGGELPGVRLVAAYAGESDLVLGQTGGKG